MSNIKHYIQELMNGNSFFSTKLIYRYIVIVLSILHIVNAVFFLIGGSMILMILSLFLSATGFSFLLSLISHEHLTTAFLVVLLESVLDIFVTILLMGWDCGFASYLFACVTASFYFTFVKGNKEKAHPVLPLILSLLMILCFFINYWLKWYVPPLMPLESQGVATALFIFNTITAFGAMIIFSYLFVWELNSRQLILTEANEKLEELAHKDPLTKLLNRRYMNEILASRMETLKKNGRRFTMVLGDIDDFKKVNDTYGHDAGDEVLVKVSDTIRNGVGEDDAVCRWGGEEILILVSSPMEMAAVTAEKIRQTIENMVVPFEDQEIRVTMTFGITESIPGYRLEHLIQQADDKLYYGKKNGKNQVVTDIRKV